MGKSKAKTPAQEVWPQAEFVTIAGNLGLPLIIILLYSVIGLIRYGSSNNHYGLMIAGSVLSIVGAFAYMMASYIYGAASKKSFVAMFLTFLGFTPYVFGCYIAFYQGFWGFTEVKNGNAVWLVIKAVAAILLGYWIVNKTYQLTELDKKVARTAKSLNLQ